MSRKKSHPSSGRVLLQPALPDDQAALQEYLTPAPSLPAGAPSSSPMMQTTAAPDQTKPAAKVPRARLQWPLDPELEVGLRTMALKQRRKNWQLLEDAVREYLVKHGQLSPDS